MPIETPLGWNCEQILKKTDHHEALIGLSSIGKYNLFYTPLSLNVFMQGIYEIANTLNISKVNEMYLLCWIRFLEFRRMLLTEEELQRNYVHNNINITSY